MNFNIIYSAYNNKTDQDLKKNVMLDLLSKELNKSGIDGYSIQDQIGCYKNKIEISYTLSIFGITKSKAFEVASSIKDLFNQEEVVIIPVKNEAYFI